MVCSSECSHGKWTGTVLGEGVRTASWETRSVVPPSGHSTIHFNSQMFGWPSHIVKRKNTYDCVQHSLSIIDTLSACKACWAEMFWDTKEYIHWDSTQSGGSVRSRRSGRCGATASQPSQGFLVQGQSRSSWRLSADTQPSLEGCVSDTISYIVPPESKRLSSALKSLNSKGLRWLAQEFETLQIRWFNKLTISNYIHTAKSSLS